MDYLNDYCSHYIYANQNNLIQVAIDVLTSSQNFFNGFPFC